MDKVEQLNAIFSPKAIAVIGASTQKGKVGHDIFANILKGEFKGKLFPVNKDATPISGVKAYKNIADINDEIDLAIIILPPKIALEAVKESIQKKIKGIVIVSAGFKEVGEEGAKIENEITELCQKAKVCLVGPNCLGVINPVEDTSLNASFSSRMPKTGNISFISQSGALCTSVLDFAAERGFGFSKFISIGNKAGVDEIDLLKYFHNDPKTKVIMIYMEGLSGNCKEFVEVAKEISSANPPTPIVVIKSGKTTAGAAAAASHTGTLAGSDAVYDGIFKQAGILRCDSVVNLFDYALAFSSEGILGGNNIAIVTNAGGPGIIATDMTERSGLKLAKFSDETIKELKKYLPPTANFNNPVDVIGDALSDRYKNSLLTVLSDQNVNGALTILTPQSMTDAMGTAEAIIEIKKIVRKPIICCFMGIFDVSAGVNLLREHQIPTYKFPEQAAYAMGGLHLIHRWYYRKQLVQYRLVYDKEKAKEIIQKSIKKGKEFLNEKEGAELLKAYGFETPPMEIAKTSDEALKIAQKIKFPVVLKIVSPQIQHKTDAKGIQMNLKTKEEVKKAFEEIMQNAHNYNKKAEIEGILVQKMAPPAIVETILGINRSKIGHIIMFGLGGIFVELFKDVVFRLAPIGRNVARRMIKEIKGYPMFKGFRGSKLADREKVEKNLVSLSQLSADFPEIKEIDINPLFVYEEGQGTLVCDNVIKFNLKPSSKKTKKD